MIDRALTERARRAQIRQMDPGRLLDLARGIDAIHRDRSAHPEARRWAVSMAGLLAPIARERQRDMNWGVDPSEYADGYTEGEIEA